MAEVRYDLWRRAEEVVGDVAALRDRLRAESIQAGDRARDVVEHLSDELFRVAEGLRDALQSATEEPSTDDERLQFHLGVMEARERWEHLRPFLLEVASEIRQRGEQALSAIERARIREELAKMDVGEVVEERADRVRQTLAAGRSIANEEIAVAIDDMKAAFRLVWDSFEEHRRGGAEARPGAPPG